MSEVEEIPSNSAVENPTEPVVTTNVTQESSNLTSMEPPLTIPPLSMQKSLEENTDVTMESKKEKKPKKRAKMGETQAIAPNVIAEVAKMESTIECPNVEIAEFLSLSFCSQKLLPKAKKRPPPKPAPPKSDTEGAAEGDTTEAKDDDKSKSPPPKKRSASRSPSPRPRKKKSNNSSSYYNAPQIEEWYCELCDATANSIATWQSHLDGKRHLRKLTAANEEGDFRFGCVPQMQARPSELFSRVASFKRNSKPNCTAKLMEKLDLIKSPCVGLKYITEIWLLDETADPVYICSLCTAFCQLNSILGHIIGFKHRLAYTKIADPQSYEMVKKLAKKSDLTQALERETEKLEDRDGRGEIVVEEEIQGGNYSYEDYVKSNGPSAGDYRSFGWRDNPVGNPQVLSASAKMDLLETLVRSIEPFELHSDNDVFEIQHCMRNLTTALRRYTPNSFIPGLKEFLAKDGPPKPKMNPQPAPIAQAPVPNRPLFPIQQQQQQQQSPSMYGANHPRAPGTPLIGQSPRYFTPSPNPRFSFQSSTPYQSGSSYQTSTPHQSNTTPYQSSTSYQSTPYQSATSFQSSFQSATSSYQSPTTSQMGYFGPMTSTPRMPLGKGFY